LDEAASPIARSILESLDITIIAVADPDFARQFLGEEEDFNEDAFWKAEIGYGRLPKKVDSLRASLGFSAEQITELREKRRALQLQFSGSVHSASRAAMRAAFVPSLQHKDRWSSSFLGHVSRWSPFLLSYLAIEIHVFSETIFSLIHEAPAKAWLTNLPSGVRPEGFLVSYMALQELLDTYSGMIPPSEKWWCEHKGDLDLV